MQIRNILFVLLFIVNLGHGQSSPTSNLNFTSLEDLISYANESSVDLKNNSIRIDQAKKEKLSALLGTIDVTGNLLSATITNNTNLGVNLFPAEIFGGEPGTFQEVELGVQHNTHINNYLDVKLYNPSAYSNLKLADINIELAEINNEVSINQYQESLASAYYNIVNIQKQIQNTEKTLSTSDSLRVLVLNKYDDGLLSQQDVNDSEVNHLKLEESKNQLEYMLEQYYLSLKILLDADEDVDLRITENELVKLGSEAPSIQANDLGLRQFVTKEKYAIQNYKSSKLAFSPTVSLQFSNSWNLYNTDFTPFSGNWINSNYVGLRLNVPIPNSRQVSNRNNAKYELEVARNNTIKEKNKANLEVETLQSEYLQSVSQIATNQKVLDLQKDTYRKNLNLYDEGLMSLDVTLQSLNAVLAAEYDLTSSMVSQSLVDARIKINNNIY